MTPFPGRGALAILKEPPIRLLVRRLVRVLPFGLRRKAWWDAAARPHYLHGVLYAAEQARREGRPSVAVIEFGVAEGAGLLAMQAYAAAVERESGVEVRVYGFDTGRGLPTGTGDHRDHPDVWKAGDFPMDEAALRPRLAARTTLVLGDLATTAMGQTFAAPIGFAALDLDLYSSTAAALQVLLREDVARLRRVALYVDDVEGASYHRFAGALLAIEEFNRGSAQVKIDRWRGVQGGRPFPDAHWLRRMYVAHDLGAIGGVTLDRGPATR